MIAISFSLELKFPQKNAVQKFAQQQAMQFCPPTLKVKVTHYLSGLVI